MLKTNQLTILNFLLLSVITGCSSTGFLMVSPEVTMIDKVGAPKLTGENHD